MARRFFVCALARVFFLCTLHGAVFPRRFSRMASNIFLVDE
jgi:hypothetical protein